MTATPKSRDGRGWPGHILWGRVRTSTAALLIAFLGVWWLYETYQPQPEPPQVPATQVVPPGFIPDPSYTWVPRTDVQRRPTTTTTTPTTTPTETETTSPTEPTEPGEPPTSPTSPTSPGVPTPTTSAPPGPSPSPGSPTPTPSPSPAPGQGPMSTPAAPTQ